MSKEKEHLVVKASGLGICLFILFFGILAGDIVLSNEDMEFFPKSVILLTASVCAGISFRLLLKRTLRTLLQHHNSKASILWHSAFFMVQLLHLHMTTGKT